MTDTRKPMTTKGEPVLTADMCRHLIELLAAPYWCPVGQGERNTAMALTQRGYVRRTFAHGRPYELTAAGRARGEAERAAHDGTSDTTGKDASNGQQG